MSYWPAPNNFRFLLLVEAIRLPEVVMTPSGAVHMGAAGAFLFLELLLTERWYIDIFKDRRHLLQSFTIKWKTCKRTLWTDDHGSSDHEQQENRVWMADFIASVERPIKNGLQSSTVTNLSYSQVLQC